MNGPLTLSIRVDACGGHGLRRMKHDDEMMNGGVHHDWRLEIVVTLDLVCT